MNILSTKPALAASATFTISAFTPRSVHDFDKITGPCHLRDYSTGSYPPDSPSPSSDGYYDVPGNNGDGTCPRPNDCGSVAIPSNAGIPVGTVILIDGVGYRINQGTGPPVGRVDVFMDNMDSAFEFGIQDRSVTWPVDACGTTPPPPPPPPVQPPPPPPPPGDTQPDGNVDQVDCNTIRGWAYDPDSTSTALGIHIYIDGTGYDTGATTIDRTDVNDARGINGYHGFSWSVPSRWRDGATHNVDVYALGVDRNGNGNGVNPRIGGGRIGPCGGNPPPVQPPPVQPPPVQPPPVQPPPVNPPPVNVQPPQGKLTLAPKCRNGASVVDMSWLPVPAGTNYNAYGVNMISMTGPFGGWSKHNLPTSQLSITGTTDLDQVMPFGPKVNLTQGARYQVTVSYELNSAPDNINGFTWGDGEFVAVSCGTPPPPVQPPPVQPPPVQPPPVQPPPPPSIPAPSITATCTTGTPSFEITWNKVSGISPSSFTIDVDNDAANAFENPDGWWYRDSAVPTGDSYQTTGPNGFAHYPGGGSLSLTPGANYQFRINYRTSAGSNYSSATTKPMRSDCGSYETHLNLTTPSTQVYPGETVPVFINLRNVGTLATPDGTTHTVFNIDASGPATQPAPVFVGSIGLPPTSCSGNANGAQQFTSYARGNPEYCQKPTLGNYGGTRNLWEVPFAALPPNSAITQAQINLPIRSDAPAGTFCLTTYWQPLSSNTSNPGRTDPGGTLPGDGVCLTVQQIDQPYDAFYGNDVHAGAVLAGSANPENCNIVAPTPAFIKGQHVLDSGGTHHGTRSQYGFSATGTITDAGSNRLPPLTSSASELMTFANQISGFASRGEIPHRIICRPDYTKLTATIPAYTDSDNQASIQNFLQHMTNNGVSEAVIKWEGSGPGPKELIGSGGNSTIPATYRLTIISDDPILISTNVYYVTDTTTNPSYANRSAVPAFALVSNQNIAIKPSVDVLTGLYAANQILSTCSNSAETASLDTPALSSPGNACRDRRLDIYGAVHADSFYFRRLAGTASSQTAVSNDSVAAERVIAMPELWIQPPPGLGASAYGTYFKSDLPPLR